MPTNPTPQDTRSAKNRILIALSPHDHSFASGGMSILHTTQALCYSGYCPSPTPDQSINHHYASFILTYNFCAKDPYESQDPNHMIEDNCLPLYKTKFDTRSQTIKHSKCLHYKKRENTCTKWSIDFDE